MSTLLFPLLALHNYLRWIVLAALLYMLIRYFIGWNRNTPWRDLDDKIGLVVTSLIDTQFLLGLLLYVVKRFSVSTRILTEHIIPMVLVVILAHIGRSRIKKADQDTLKHKNGAIWFTISLLIILLSIPWYRPLLRGL